MIKKNIYRGKKKLIQVFLTFKVYLSLKRKYRLSDFAIIGVQKGGTTWLYNILSEHPEVFMPFIENTSDPSEVRFYDERLKKGIAWYENLYKKNHNFIKGDKTPKYYLMPWYKILLIKKIQPKLNIILVLRCPIHRAWSDALMNLKRFNNLDYEDNKNKYRSYLLKKINRGLYYKHLKKWLSVFDKEQIHIVIYEEIVDSPREYLKDIFRFINLRDFKISQETIDRKYNVNPIKPIPSEIISLLKPYFLSDIENLKMKFPDLSFNKWEIYNS